MSSVNQHEVLDVENIRKTFPILHQKIHNKPLVYLDNAATTQKPESVILALDEYYRLNNANIHRAVHTLANRATEAYEETRGALKSFVGAPLQEEIIFTRGVTESVNLLANSLGSTVLNPNDTILISALEHHSNIVPWQMVAERMQANIKVIPILESCDIDMEAYRELLNDRVKIVAVNHASNSLGTINPIKKIIDLAHQAGALTCIDGAQAAAHLPINVQELDCDFYAISAHKMYGPTGIGMLYGKKAILDKLPPYMGGGEMIRNVSFDRTTYNDLPYKFEAGTPNIADAIAWKKSIEFIHTIDKEKMAGHETALLHYAKEKLAAIDRVKIIGNPISQVSTLSFTVKGLHPFDVGQWLDTFGIAVRTGHHCTQPLMDLLGIEGTIRASFAVYNTMAEVDQLADRLEYIIRKIG